MTTGERIATALDEIDRNQAWLARALGVSEMTVSRYCRDEVTVPKDTRGPLAKAVGKSQRHLFQGGK